MPRRLNELEILCIRESGKSAGLSSRNSIISDMRISTVSLSG
jgi:hypothetical protein